ncbi:hypothetical protein M427DRAFT_280794 [Gonapodya prolifera JEL478]|uniref:Uncharacterized protein n=1 Tax=Gonapodya prolifera (strain JEL478) TaxID=1344416 RepID=A0A139AZG6_GONPJ|nr:hypothetical protein M427DRAFT_280794 [Gonapodya prolifera JEL478]|eukprot:KXS21875.1 hypothetical protein M427DRAFT_280794 [Gonapodya prolifera JEL478]
MSKLVNGRRSCTLVGALVQLPRLLTYIDSHYIDFAELMEIMQISLRELAPPTAKITEIEPEEIPSEPAAKPPSGSRVSTKQSTVLDTPASASPEKASASETDQDSPPRQTKGPRGPRPSPFLQKQKSWKRMFSGPY